LKSEAVRIVCENIIGEDSVKLKVDVRRIVERLEAIYACGKQEDGTHSRIAYSLEDQRGRAVFSAFFHELGLIPREDAAGNVIVRREGIRSDAPAILIGSHLDTVADGGRYDGAYGCVAALEVMEVLAAAGIVTEHPLEIVVFTDEEGVRFGNGMFGSTAFCGGDLETFMPDDLDAEGHSRTDVLAACGIDLSQVRNAVRSRESIHAFIELHIEQGKTLNHAGHSIGIVSSIAGVMRGEVTIRGEANHAGATMMNDRRDALVAAAGCIAGLPELVRENGGDYSVATVGSINVSPNAVNVVPGLCQFVLEIRDRDTAVMDRIEAAFHTELDRIAVATGVAIEWRELARQTPGRMSDWVSGKIESACTICGYDYSTLPSGAFHDALKASSVFPTGMIFVPSVGGISHSPIEETRVEDLEAGAEVLLQTILKLDGCEGETDESI
jgi:hydantoinase/carbamoylase family amidase